MGMMDDAKDKMSDMGDDMRKKYDELKQREQAGTLDDKARDELDRLQARMSDNQ